MRLKDNRKKGTGGRFFCLRLSRRQKNRPPVPFTF